MNTGIMVLAAGKSRRFGSDKRLALLPDGRPSIEQLLDHLEQSRLPVLVCLAPEDGDMAGLLKERGFDYCFCERSAEGMGGTLAEGVTRLESSWEGVLVALADMPWIAGPTYRAVADHLQADTICVPTYKRQRGHPVGFGQQYFSELSALDGDTGARHLLRKYQREVREVDVDDAAILCDIDTPGDIEPRNDQRLC